MRDIDYITGERLKSMQAGSIGNNTRIFYNGKEWNGERLTLCKF